MVISIRWSPAQDMGLGGHDMAIQSRVITTSSALIKCWNFVDGPGVGLRDRDLCHVRLYPFWFEPIAGYRSWTVASNLHSGQLAVGLCHDQGSLLLAGPLFHHPQSHKHRGGGHDMANEEDPSVFTLNRLQAWYWLRVDLPGLDKMMPDHETASEGPVRSFIYC